VHPVVFHQTLDLLNVAEPQVRQYDNELRILVASPGQHFDKEAAEAAVKHVVHAAGATGLR